MTSRSWDRVIAELAKRQHGVVARRQLLALGMGGEAIRGRLNRGSLHEVHRGVYVVGARRISRKGRWMAAVLAGGPGAVLSHRSAGVLWRLVPPSLSQVDITCARGRGPRRAGIACHQAALAADETTEVDRIPVTSPFRTILDLAGVLRPRHLERAWNELEVRQLTDVVPMAVVLERHRGKRGLANLRTVMGSKEPGGITRNEFEESFVALLDSHELPRPRMNASVWVRGRFFEADCLWDAQRLIVELDGGEAHGTKRAFQSDRHRDRILLAEGYRTSRVTWHQLHNEPSEVVADLKQALESSDRHPHPPAK